MKAASLFIAVTRACTKESGMKRTQLNSLFLVLALAGSSAAQAPTWKAELLGTPQPSWSLTAVSALNDSGRTVGNTYVSGWKRAWVAGPDHPLELLPLPAGVDWSEATDVNSSGMVCGNVLINGGSQGAVWKPGPSGYQVQVMPPGPGGVLTVNAQAINDAGEVVGKLGPLSGSYYWTEAAGLTQLPTSVFPDVPEDINNRRQVIADLYRLDLDTMVLENLGSPTGTGYNYLFTVLWAINDSGDCVGYGNTASSGWNKQAMRYTEGVGWKAFNTPLITASAMDIAENGDTTYQLGTFGLHVWVEGYGNIPLQNTLAPAYAHFDVSGAFAPYISPGSLIATNGADTSTGESGIVLLTPLHSTPATAYCTAGTSASGCTATLSGVGAASATASSGFELRAFTVEGAKDGLFFWGTNGRQANPWGSGTSLQCVAPPVNRGGLLTGTGAAGACDGTFVQDLNARWCSTCPKPGQNPGAGAVVQAQLWYRDPLNTSNQTTSLSDAVEFTVLP